LAIINRNPAPVLGLLTTFWEENGVDTSADPGGSSGGVLDPEIQAQYGALASVIRSSIADGKLTLTLTYLINKKKNLTLVSIKSIRPNPNPNSNSNPKPNSNPNPNSNSNPKPNSNMGLLLR
jgi:hypothetical protein